MLDAVRRSAREMEPMSFVTSGLLRDCVQLATQAQSGRVAVELLRASRTAVEAIPRLSHHGPVIARIRDCLRGARPRAELRAWPLAELEAWSAALDDWEAKLKMQHEWSVEEVSPAQ